MESDEELGEDQVGSHCPSEIPLPTTTYQHQLLYQEHFEAIGMKTMPERIGFTSVTAQNYG